MRNFRGGTGANEFFPRWSGFLAWDAPYAIWRSSAYNSTESICTGQFFCNRISHGKT